MLNSYRSEAVYDFSISLRNIAFDRFNLTFTLLSLISRSFAVSAVFIPLISRKVKTIRYSKGISVSASSIRIDNYFLLTTFSMSLLLLLNIGIAFSFTFAVISFLDRRSVV